MALVIKNPPANVGDAGLFPGSGRSSGVGNGNPLQYPCPENTTDRGAWWATVLGVTNSRTQLSTHTSMNAGCINIIEANTVFLNKQ